MVKLCMKIDCGRKSSGEHKALIDLDNVAHFCWYDIRYENFDENLPKTDRFQIPFYVHSIYLFFVLNKFHFKHGL